MLKMIQGKVLSTNNSIVHVTISDRLTEKRNTAELIETQSIAFLEMIGSVLVDWMLQCQTVHQEYYKNFLKPFVSQSEENYRFCG